MSTAVRLRCVAGHPRAKERAGDRGISDLGSRHETTGQRHVRAPVAGEVSSFGTHG